MSPCLSGMEPVFVSTATRTLIKHYANDITRAFRSDNLEKRKLRQLDQAL
jgi:hypothetical protein